MAAGGALHRRRAQKRAHASAGPRAPFPSTPARVSPTPSVIRVNSHGKRLTECSEVQLRLRWRGRPCPWVLNAARCVSSPRANTPCLVGFLSECGAVWSGGRRRRSFTRPGGGAPMVGGLPAAHACELCMPSRRWMWRRVGSVHWSRRRERRQRPSSGRGLRAMMEGLAAAHARTRCCQLRPVGEPPRGGEPCECWLTLSKA